MAACASTGNLANSVAAHAARAGMESFVFVPHDLEAVKLITTAVFGGHLIAVDGSYDDVNRLCAELASEFAVLGVRERQRSARTTPKGRRPWPSRSPSSSAGSCPTTSSSRSLLGASSPRSTRGFRQLAELGLVDEDGEVRISGAQAAGCSPVATAFAEGSDHVRPVKPATIAKSLAIGNPADGWYALEVVRRTGGAIAAVTDEEIIEGIRLLARTEGIFAETAGGVTVATLAKLAAAGVVRSDERVVVYITGNGLKTTEALSGRIGPSATIPPTLEAVAELIDRDGRLRAASR